MRAANRRGETGLRNLKPQNGKEEKEEGFEIEARSREHLMLGSLRCSRVSLKVVRREIWPLSKRSVEMLEKKDAQSSKDETLRMGFVHLYYSPHSIRLQCPS